ncbi:MAG: hypothetical protein K8S27_00365 [Candidatus Omnitrophica bacterium]|nr:hypothetical protein [Candidatus Omnitrophota bacterium]
MCSKLTVFSFFLVVGLLINPADLLANQTSDLDNLLDQINSRDSDQTVGDVLQKIIESTGSDIPDPDELSVDPQEEEEGVDAGDVELFKKLKKTTPGPLLIELNQLQSCVDDKWGISFLCHPRWGVEENPQALSLIISVEPTVTFTVVKFNKRIKFIAQLNRFHLESMGQYSRGFKMESINLGRYKAVKVKAFSSVYPDMRIVDFFVLHDEVLYGFLFSVSPKEEWDNYKRLIHKIVRSLEFQDNLNQSKLFLPDTP